MESKKQKSKRERQEYVQKSYSEIVPGDGTSIGAWAKYMANRFKVTEVTIFSDIKPIVEARRKELNNATL